MILWFEFKRGEFSIRSTTAGSKILRSRANGTVLVAFDDYAFRCRFDRHHCAGSPGYHHYSRRCDHSSNHDGPEQEHRLAHHHYTGAVDALDVRARCSRRLFRREILRRDEVGNILRCSGRTRRIVLRPDWLVRWSGNWRDHW